MSGKPRKAPKLVYSNFEDRFYLLTSYDVRADGSIVPLTKFDVTDQIVFLAPDIARVARKAKRI